MTSSWSDRVRIEFGSCSDRSRIGIFNCFGKFFFDFGMQFCVAGAVYLVRLEGDAWCSAHCK